MTTYYEKNKEKIKNYYQMNKQRINERIDKDYIKQYNQKYYRDNIKKIKDIRQSYYAINKEFLNEYDIIRHKIIKDYGKFYVKNQNLVYNHEKHSFIKKPLKEIII
jgi:hypothetical protein